MKKAIIIILTAMLALSVFVSCKQEELVDDLFNSGVDVTFDANGGTGSMAVQKVKKNVATALNTNAFTYDGYLLKSWNTEADGSGTSYADGAAITVSEAITLYAQWVDANTVIIATTTELTNGNEYSMISDVTVEGRIKVSGTVTIDLAEGLTLTIPKGIQVSAGNSLTIKGTGSLIINGVESGNAGIGGNDGENGGSITISGGSVNVTGGSDAPGIGGGNGGTAGTITISEDADVTSTGGKVSVIFNANGGTGTMVSQVMAKDTATALKANSFTKTGCAFSGWNTKTDGTGTAYEAGASVTLESDLMLYAQWIYPITSSTTTLSDGIEYTLIDNVTSGNRLNVNGSVTINLPAGKTLTIPKGIHVSAGNSLTIKGEGSLVIDPGDPDDYVNDLNAGIGGNKGETSGTIVIEGGDITVTGGNWGAGIGASDNGGTCGDITISGGTVKAYGGDRGAGIGGSPKGAVGTITISGGSVTATGGTQAAGIGSAHYGLGGTIIISGGTVTATGSAKAAGIGGGFNGSNDRNITITGGTITATGGSDADGIGAGYYSKGSTTLSVGSEVHLQVSSNGSSWSDYDGTTRKQYMKTI